ncbi:hypothetical protein [Oerskovia merdavium]|uniref:DUF222 domain-containing protein n=1 Tax=Oerskovia merdavium TaxID=2762227 RepID=A0ABR8U4U4_9CELL|nr:hypothetical protein [Oerskovia merdavium]MBD7982544.1 hypothetical protein [Oerskovia merdavium]
MTRQEPAADLSRLARELAFSGDLADEHVRWALYDQALGRGLHDLVAAAVAEDDDQVMASGVVVAALERVPSVDRERWVALTSEWTVADFVARRAAELEILESVSGAVAAVGDGLRRADEGLGVDGWSDWLQLRAASSATRADVLDALAGGGRTRRIRHVAATTRSRSAGGDG